MTSHSRNVKYRANVKLVFGTCEPTTVSLHFILLILMFLEYNRCFRHELQVIYMFLPKLLSSIGTLYE